RDPQTKPFWVKDMIAVIQPVNQPEQRRDPFRANAPSGAAAPPGTPADGQASRRPEHGQVFCFYSGKGGVGKSLIAANLAVSMANETKGKVALVDLDLQFGDIGVLLNLDHSQGITDLIENIDHM